MLEDEGCSELMFTMTIMYRISEDIAPQNVRYRESSQSSVNDRIMW